MTTKKTDKKVTTKAVKEANKVYTGTGRRKTSVAAVRIQEGSGNFTVNSKPVDEFFPKESNWLHHIKESLKVLNIEKKFDISSKVSGGGISGQAGALRLGLARSLDKFEMDHIGQTSANDILLEGLGIPEGPINEAQANSLPAEYFQRVWHRVLRKMGMLTRDSRAVLSKVTGRVKARKAKQFSKR
jgi:small subunit ribosomal protein S9